MGTGGLSWRSFAIQDWSRSNRRSHRRTRWASGASCLQSKASTTLSLACAPTAPNSSARWPSTRTSTDSATCEALRASSSRWPRNSSEAFTAFGETGGVAGDQELVADLIAQGLRAQLELQSLITGVLYVGLEIVEGSPARLALPPGSGYREIPSLPTTLEQAQAKLSEVLTQLSKLDVGGIGRSVTSAADGVPRLASSPDLQSAIVTLREALGAVRDVAGSVDARIGPLAANVNGRVDDARDSLKRLDGALDNVTALTDPRAPLADGLGAAITEVTGAARAVRQLADELSRNPNIILTGRGGSR